MGQDFEGGKIASSSHGTYGVPSQIVDLYEDWLGVPISPVETRNAVTLQLFEAGVVYSSDGGGYAVRAEVDEYAQGWFPISAEEDIAAATTAGRAQRFKDASGLEMTVYSARDTGVHGVAGPRLDLYERLGGPGSSLGFPMSDSIPYLDGYGGRQSQKFEHGVIYHQTRADPVAVPAETVELVGFRRLGWPTSEERLVGDNTDESIQFFEMGVVTVRDGKREFWLRP